MDITKKNLKTSHKKTAAETTLAAAFFCGLRCQPLRKKGKTATE